MKLLLMLVAFIQSPAFKVALELVEHAMTRFTTNQDRREWVVAELQTRCHVPERVARMIVELVLLELKPAEAPPADAVPS